MSPDRGGNIIGIQAKRRYGCRIELPRRLEASTLLKALQSTLHAWTPDPVDASRIEAELVKAALDRPDGLP